uniref:Uncharacterized protein n=1 Tax=Avena sativa TaxID=4498 RepID=A0ACD5ZP40_AVESA
MASPLPIHDQVSIPVAAGDMQASAADFSTSKPLAEQAATLSISCMMDAKQFPPWSDLRPELLGLVLKRLPSLADRVRLRAVCHPWRFNTISETLPLPFPWLTLPNGSFLSIPGGEIHCMPVPNGASCHGSIDNSLFLMSSDVAAWQKEIDAHAHGPVSYKLVASSPPDSSPKWLAASLIIGNGYSDNICIIKPRVAAYSFKPSVGPYPLVDFVFFGGRLHIVSEFFKLFTVDFSEDLESNANISCAIDSIGDFLGPAKYLDPKRYYELEQYLVESGGKLFMVQRFMALEGFRSLHTVGFKVLEADMRTNPGQWRMVNDLGGHSLFLGKQSSKSLPAEESCGLQEDCIYFICDYPCPESSANPLHDAGIYNMRSGTIMPLHSGSSAVPQRQAGQWGLTWFFPPEAV